MDGPGVLVIRLHPSLRSVTDQNIRIFIIEGCATIVLGFVCFFCLPDSPALSTRWMNDEERRFMELQSVIKNGGRHSTETADKFRWCLLVELVTDIKVWMQGFILFTMGSVTYGEFFPCEQRPHETYSCTRLQVHYAIHHAVDGVRKYLRSTARRHTLHLLLPCTRLTSSSPSRHTSQAPSLP